MERSKTLSPVTCRTPSLATAMVQSFSIPETCSTTRCLCSRCYGMVASGALLDHSCVSPSTPLDVSNALLKSIEVYVILSDNPDYIWQRCEHFVSLRKALGRVQSALRMVFMTLVISSSSKMTQDQFRTLVKPSMDPLEDVLPPVMNCRSDIAERYTEFHREVQALIMSIEVV